MAFIADILLAAGALAAGFYCFILSRRLRLRPCMICRNLPNPNVRLIRFLCGSL